MSIPSGDDLTPIELLVLSTAGGDNTLGIAYGLVALRRIAERPFSSTKHKYLADAAAAVPVTLPGRFSLAFADLKIGCLVKGAAQELR